MYSLKFKLSDLLIFLSIALIPFSYFEVFGVRVIALAVPLILIFLLTRRSVSFDNGLVLFLPVFFLAFVLSLISGSKIFVSSVVFFLYLLIFYSCERVCFFSSLSRFVNVYAMGAIFSAAGVIVQRFLYESLGYKFGKIDIYGGGRVGYGFLWQDYSFLSLYLVSALPLAFYSYRKFHVKIVVSMVLLVGSVVTTARTGLGALLLATIFIGGLELARGLIIGRIGKKSLLILVFLMLASVAVFYFYVEFSSRSLSFNASGRVEGYFLGVKSFLDNPLLGVMFDETYYSERYGVIPHNVFVYVLSHGGILSLAFFIVWFLYVLYVAAFKVELFRYSVIIVLFGFMFIPSFFSGYFFALLVSLCMAESRVYVNKVAQK